MPTITITENSTGGTHSGTEDTYLREASPTANQDSQQINVFSYLVGDRGNGLIRFTLPGVLAGATINSATLSLFITDRTTIKTVDVHRVLRAWTETGATWNTYDGTNNWGTAGGTNAADISAATASTVVSELSLIYQDFTGLAADVQAWVDGAANNGWLLKRNDYTAYDGNFFVFQRSEGTDGQRPKLVIDYTAGSGGTPPGIATETDTALALAGKQIRALGMASETDAALALVTLAGLPFNTAPYEFGQRTGLDVADFAIYASTALNVSVYAESDVLLASQLFSYTETTGSNGRLTRKTHASLTASSWYFFVARNADGSLSGCGRIQAT